MRPALALLLCSALSACGGQSPLLGVFEGEGVDNMQWAGIEEMVSNNFLTRIYVSPLSDGRLLMSELCELTATVVSDTELRIEPRQCPTVTFSSECTLSRSVGEGTGKLEGDALTLLYLGDAFVQCPGDQDFSGTTTTRVVATRL